MIYKWHTRRTNECDAHNENQERNQRIADEWKVDDDIILFWLCVIFAHGPPEQKYETIKR